MSDAPIERVGIVGCGIMGAGIAHLSAAADLDVVVVTSSEEARERGRARLVRSLDAAVRGGRVTQEERDNAHGRISMSLSMDDLADRTLLIEAVPEAPELKTSVFEALDKIVADEDALLVSNTSSISITRLAAVTSRPERVLGLHFFNPAPVMPLVELTPPLQTSRVSRDRLERFATQRLGKHVIVAPDRAGFVVNAMLVPYLLSAIRMVESGYASVQDVDDGMRLGCGHPMGPLSLTDLIGLDTVQSVARALYDEFRVPEYASPPLLNRMVDGGLLGKKSGRGFHTYRASGTT